MSEEESAAQRLLREARTVSALDHSNICTIYEIGKAQDGQTFIAMAYCDGENPGHAESHFALSYACRYAGMLRESAEEGETALKLDPNNPRYRSLATTYLYLGDYDRALEVHKLDPDSPQTPARMGQIFLLCGQTRQALEHLDRTIEKEPESSNGRWAVAMRAHLLGKRQEGLAALRRSEERGIPKTLQWRNSENGHQKKWFALARGQAGLAAEPRSRSTSRMGGLPKSLLYSRLKCDGSS